MDYEEIIQDIKAKKYRPIYFLTGEEPFFIDRIANRIEKEVLTEDEKAFNQTVVYGSETTMTAVTDTARRFPMMSERQVVIVREAQDINDFDNLIPYIDHFQPATILLMTYKNKKADGRKEVFKKLKASPNCVWYESKKIYDDKVPGWVTDYCRTNGYAITPKAASILAECLGNDLSKVANEIDKLMLLVPKGGAINEQLVEQHTGISKDFNNFELLAAIIRKDHLKANRIVNYFKANPKSNPLPVTISVLFNYFQTLLTYHYQKNKPLSQDELLRSLKVRSAYFLRDYTNGARVYSPMKCASVISLLHEYDMKSKGGNSVNYEDGELVKELVFKIMH